jgi:hypothetical protein
MSICGVVLVVNTVDIGGLIAVPMAPEYVYLGINVGTRTRRRLIVLELVAWVQCEFRSIMLSAQLSSSLAHYLFVSNPSLE